MKYFKKFNIVKTEEHKNYNISKIDSLSFSVQQLIHMFIEQ